MTLSRGNTLVKLGTDGQPVQGETYYQWEIVDLSPTYQWIGYADRSDAHLAPGDTVQILIVKKVA